MDGIAIDTTGNVSVRSLVSHIMPELHTSSILRGVHRALKGSGDGMSTTLMNGRLTKTATIDTSCLILDKMSGPTWDAWRVSSGPAFKQALRERVASVVAAGQVEQANPPTQRAEEQRVEEQRMDEHPEQQEKKAVVLSKALRAVNIDGSVRVDEATGMVSNIDVIRMLCPDVNPNHAAQMLTRVLDKNDREPSIKSRVSYIKINGSGNKTPVTDFSTLVEIIWMLPTGSSREFRRKAAETMCQVMGGDISLCRQIEQNDLWWKSMDGGEAIQQDLITPVRYKEEWESGRVKECRVRDALACAVGGTTEVETSSGFIDVLSETEVIEVKYYRKWKDGLGQVLAYQSHYPRLARRLHLFARNGDRDTDKYCELAKSVCGQHMVQVTFEEVVVQEPELDLDGDDASTVVGCEYEGESGEGPEPFWFKYASIGEKRSYASMEASSRAIDTMTCCKERLESVGRFDEVAADEFADGIKRIQRRI